MTNRMWVGEEEGEGKGSGMFSSVHHQLWGERAHLSGPEVAASWLWRKHPLADVQGKE